MRMTKEAPKSIERKESEKPRDVTKALGERTLQVLKSVFNALPSKPKMATRKDAIEWAMSLGFALKDTVGKITENVVKPASFSKERKTFLEGLKEPAIAGVIFLNALAGASPAGAEEMKKKLTQDAQTKHELVVDMKNDKTIGQFIPEKKPYEAILYDADELYPKLKEWKIKHPDVKRIEVSEFRAAIKVTHDDKKHTHQNKGEVTILARVFFKDGTNKNMSVTGTGIFMPESLDYYMQESNQKIGDILEGAGIARQIPAGQKELHKEKSPFYENYGEKNVPGVALCVQFAKKDAMKKLLAELDAVASESKKSK